MIDHRILPEVVLLEGINRVGKSTVIKEFQEAYPKQIQVVKFPYQKRIVSKIVFLYQEIERMTDLKRALQYLEIIHQLFDLDFRQFSTLTEIDDLSKVYFLDRYYPSNLVYAAMHGVEINPVWSDNHCLKPDIAIHLRITKDETRTKYIKDFPVYDTSDNEISNSIQVLTPEQLLYDGQVYYDNVFHGLVNANKVDRFHQVEALQESTFRDCERILMQNSIL